MRTLVLAIILAAGAIVFGGQVRPVPQCAEDATIIGVGSFDNGRWSKYECGPAVDDLR